VAADLIEPIAATYDRAAFATSFRNSAAPIRNSRRKWPMNPLASWGERHPRHRPLSRVATHRVGISRMASLQDRVSEKEHTDDL